MKRWRPDGGDEAKGYYGGYSEPSDQWEAEGRVTLDGAEMELCQECKAPVHYYDPDDAPYCETHGPGALTAISKGQFVYSGVATLG